MEVQVLTAPPSSDCPEQDYICVHTDFDPLDDTVVLATIERVTDRTKGRVKRVRTLLARQRMLASEPHADEPGFVRDEHEVGRYEALKKPNRTDDSE